jgi:hypothetical protein
MDPLVFAYIEKSARIHLTPENLFILPELKDPSVLGLSDTDKAAFVVSREYGKSLEAFSEPLMGLSQVMKEKENVKLSKWIEKTKTPIVPQLESSNQDAVFNGKSLVVMAILDPENKEIFQKSLQEMQVSVKKFKQMPEYNDVSFIWLDGIRWQSYVTRVYRLQPQQYPRLVIASPKFSEYFDVDLSGKLFEFKAEKMTNYVMDAKQDKLQGKSQSGLIGIAAKYVQKASEVIAMYPLTAAIGFVVILLGGIWALTRVLSKDATYSKVDSAKAD